MLTSLEITLFIYTCTSFAALLLFIILWHNTKTRLSHSTQMNEAIEQRLMALQKELNEIHTQNAKDGKISSVNDIIDGIPQYIAILDHNGFVTNINLTLATLLNLDKISAFGKKLTEICTLKSGMHDIDMNRMLPADAGISNLPEDTILAAPGDRTVPVSGFIHKFNSQDASFTLLFMYDVQHFKAENDQLKNILASNTEKITRLEADRNAANVFYSRNTCAYFHLSPELLIRGYNSRAAHLVNGVIGDISGKKFNDVVSLVDNKDTPVHMTDIPETADQPGNRDWLFAKIRGYKIPVKINLYRQDNDYFVEIQTYEKEYEAQEESQIFFSGVVHDLRTPLTTVRGVLDLINDEKLQIPADKKKELMTEAYKSILHMINLVNDLLQVSRLEQNRITVNKEAFDIDQITREVVDTLKVEAQTRKLFLSYPITDISLPKIYGDKMKTKEIIMNLVSNAVKYTQEGGVTIRHDVNGTMLRTFVTDTGAGIPESHKSLLFRKFQQIGHARTVSSTKSTGLGLYISKQFALLMNGDLTLSSSEAGKGSTFCLSLPITG